MSLGLDLTVSAQEGAADRHNWRVQAISGGGPVGEFVALALDRVDRAHVSCWQGGELRYSRWDGTLWQTETAVDPAGAGEFLALALDGQERPHIVYVSGATLWYIRGENGAWREPEAVAGGSFLGPVSLRFGSDGLHLGFHMNGDLVYGRLGDSGAWDTQTVVEGDAAGFYHDLALDGRGRPHFVYHNGDDNTLNYALLNGDAWVGEVVLEGGNDPFLGTENSLALDGSDLPHISYAAGEAVGYAHRHADGGWLIETMAGGGELVGATNIALFPSGAVGISYYRLGESSALHFVRRLADGWEPEPVDGEGDAGDPAVMRLDGLGRPQIVYLDFANGNLKHSHWNLPPTVKGDSIEVHVDRSVRGNVLANDVDPDGLPMTARLVKEPAFGAVDLAENGAFTYRPNLGYAGPDSFTYEGCDDNGLCGPAVVTARVFVPTLIFVGDTEWWAHEADGCRIALRLADARSSTWAGVLRENPQTMEWETVKADDGSDAWHGTRDGDEWNWWVPERYLGLGPYRWVVYSEQGGYHLVYSEPFMMPSLTGRTLVSTGTIKQMS